MDITTYCRISAGGRLRALRLRQLNTASIHRTKWLWLCRPERTNHGTRANADTDTQKRRKCLQSTLAEGLRNMDEVRAYRHNFFLRIRESVLLRLVPTLQPLRIFNIFSSIASHIMVCNFFSQIWPPETKFQASDVPDQTGKVIIVTGKCLTLFL
jgi:hypothetical protein